MAVGGWNLWSRASPVPPTPKEAGVEELVVEEPVIIEASEGFLPVNLDELFSESSSIAKSPDKSIPVLLDEPLASPLIVVSISDVPGKTASATSGRTTLISLKAAIDGKIWDEDFPLLRKLKVDLENLHGEKQGLNYGEEAEDVRRIVKRAGMVYMVRAACAEVSVRTMGNLERILSSGDGSIERARETKDGKGKRKRVSGTDSTATVESLVAMAARYRRSFADHKEAVSKLEKLIQDGKEWCSEETRQELADYWFVLQSTIGNIDNVHMELRLLVDRFEKEAVRFGEELSKA